MPSPQTPPSPTPDEQDPSPVSETVSSTSEPGGLVDDAGPAFTPGARPVREPATRTAAAKPGPKAVELEETIRSLLAGKGEILHGVFAVGPKVGLETDEWRYLQSELDTLAPPLARMIASMPAAAAAVAAGGDPIAIGAGFLGYGLRSIGERQAAVATARLRASGGAPEVIIDAPTPAADAAAADDDAGMEVPPITARGTR